MDNKIKFWLNLSFKMYRPRRRSPEKVSNVLLIWLSLFLKVCFFNGDIGFIFVFDCFFCCSSVVRSVPSRSKAPFTSGILKRIGNRVSCVWRMATCRSTRNVGYKLFPLLQVLFAFDALFPKLKRFYLFYFVWFFFTFSQFYEPSSRTNQTQNNGHCIN